MAVELARPVVGNPRRVRAEPKAPQHPFLPVRRRAPRCPRRPSQVKPLASSSSMIACLPLPKAAPVGFTRMTPAEAWRPPFAPGVTPPVPRRRPCGRPPESRALATTWRLPMGRAAKAKGAPPLPGRAPRAVRLASTCARQQLDRPHGPPPPKGCAEYPDHGLARCCATHGVVVRWEKGAAEGDAPRHTVLRQARPQPLLSGL